MTEQGFAACLAAVLNGELDVNESFDPDGVHRAVPYSEAGLLTRNAGVVVTMDNGSEFQLTVVRSRGPRR